jgi:hypothetical protein
MAYATRGVDCSQKFTIKLFRIDECNKKLVNYDALQYLNLVTFSNIYLSPPSLHKDMYKTHISSKLDWPFWIQNNIKSIRRPNAPHSLEYSAKTQSPISKPGALSLLTFTLFIPKIHTTINTLLVIIGGAIRLQKNQILS